MHEGRVIYFEDNGPFRKIVAKAVETNDSPHKVVAQAGNLGDALDILKLMADGEISANVVMFDANLSPNSTGRDARTISQNIAELGLAVRTIGLAGDPMSDIHVAVDADLPKDFYSAERLRQILDELPEPES